MILIMKILKLLSFYYFDAMFFNKRWI